MRKLVIFTLAFTVACLLYNYITSVTVLAILFSIVIITSICIISFDTYNRNKAILLCIGFVFGIIYCQVFYLLNISPIMKYNDSTVDFTAEVINFPTERDSGISLDDKTNNEAILPVKMRLYIYDGSADNLKPGDKISFTAQVSVSNLIGEDSSDYFFSQGIFLTGRRIADLEVISSSGFKLKYIHRYIFRGIRNKMYEIFPEDIKGLAIALLIGDKAILNEDVEATVNLQRSGIYHIVTVSGMHVSIFASFIYAILGKRWYSLLVLIPGLLMFMAVTGFTPAIIRAVILQLFIILAPIFKREDDKLTSLSAALMVLIICNPYVIKNVGMQLSFLSTLGIILFAPKLSEFFQRIMGFNSGLSKKRKRFIVGISTSASVTVGATLFTIPLSTIYFGYFSVIAPLTNLMIGWLTTPAFILCIIATAIGMFFVPAGKLISGIASVFLRIMLWISDKLAGSSFSALYITNIYLAMWIALVYVFIVFFIFFKKKPSFLIIPGCAAISSLCIIMICTALVHDSKPGYSMVVLDVGQGQSIVIYNDSYTAVIDCGSSSGEDAGQIAGSYIYSLGRSSIDALILTHFHTDHANGVEKLMSMVKVESLVLPNEGEEDSDLDDKIIELAEENSTDIIYVNEDKVITMGNTTLSLYAPLGSLSENERGICILVSENGFDSLVTGDIDEGQERLLVSLKRLPDIECLIVGHHGSKFSTSSDLLSTVAPEIGIISVGDNNYGHPTSEILERLDEAGIDVYRTDEYGNIVISSTGGFYG